MKFPQCANDIYLRKISCLINLTDAINVLSLIRKVDVINYYLENYLELVEAILWLLLVFKESPRLMTFFPANVKFLNLYISSWLIDMFPGNEEPLWRAWGTTNMEEGWPGEWIRGELTFILCGLLCGRPVCEDLLSKFMAGRAPSKSPKKHKNHCSLIPPLLHCTKTFTRK